MTNNHERADLEQLVSHYAAAALAHGAASRDGDAQAANRAYQRLSAIADALRSRGPAGDLSLVGLLVHDRAEVRGWAAAHTLAFAAERALPVLEAIASGPASLEELNAKMILQQWRNGSFRAP